MRPKGHPKHQHYVPQLLLRGFASRPSEQLYAFDKRSDRVFKTSIRNVAGETGFYDLTIDGGFTSFEPMLAKMEGEVGPIIDRIRIDRSIRSLTKDERVLIALFAAVQHQRTANFRARVGQMNADLAAKFRRLGMDPTAIEGFKEFDAEDLKKFTIRAIADAKELAPYFLSKGWALLQAAETTRYYIGDNPIALQNVMNRGPRGGLGFGVPGIEIYLPISTELTLAWFSETFVTQIAEALEKVRKAKILRPADSFRLDAVCEGPTRFARAFETGEAMVGIDENTVNLNSLQIRGAERFVFSPVDDFDLVRTMIHDDPDLRTGLRGEIS